VHGQREGTGGIAAAVVTMAASCGILCGGAASALALGFPSQYDEPVVRGPSRSLPALVMLQGVFGPDRVVQQGSGELRGGHWVRPTRTPRRPWEGRT
jgi:hypothetical protein